jgi:hypothetical protein
MAIVGKLETMSLPDLLQWLASNQATGTLVVSDGKVEKSIFFRSGRVISSASSDPTEYLGHFLVSHRFITETDLAEAVREQETSGAMLGRVLVERGAISHDDLDRMLKLKSEESLFELFNWQQGDFQFKDDELPPYEMVPISLDVTSLLLEGMQRQDEWTRIREVVPSALAVPVAMKDPLSGVDHSEPRVRAILRAIDDDRSIEDICLETHTSEYMVSKVVWDRAREGVLKVIRPRVVPTTPVEAAVGDAGGLLDRARELVVSGELDLAARHLRAAASLEPHDHLLRQTVRAVEQDIRDRLDETGLTDDAVPALERSLDTLANAGLSPEEGFVLSRVNGQADLASIVKISPLPELEARLVFWKLVGAEIVSLQRA